MTSAIRESGSSSSSSETDDQNEELDMMKKLVHPHARVSWGDFRLLMGAFLVHSKLADAQLELLMKILNKIAPYDFLDLSVKTFFKGYNTSPSKKVFFCTDCLVLLKEQDAQTFQCEVCEKNYNVNKLVTNRSFFSYLSVEKQIRPFLSDGVFTEAVIKHKRNVNINSVINSERYKSMKEAGIIGSNDLTLLLNTDGAQATKSSKMSLWPAQLTILELPLALRHKYVLLPLVWLHRKKPNLNEILKPLVEELSELSSAGIVTEKGTLKVHVIVCTVDSQARAMLMNMKHHNGAHSCNWCLTPGESLAKGKGHAWFFVGDLSAERRDCENILQHAQRALTAGQPCYGIKGPSIMGQLPTFDLVWGYVPEYLHNICIGIGSTLLNILLSPRFSHKDFSLSKHVKLLDERSQAITPTSEMSRVIGKISEHGNNKASVMRNLICYFLLPLIHDLVPQKILNFLLLFVYAVSVYLKENPSPRELLKAEKCVSKFCRNASDTISYQLCTYNLHIFSHVPEVCKSLGALWDTSCFPFEGHNGLILSLTSGTKYKTEQILRNHQIYMNVLHADFNDEACKQLAKTILSPTPPLKRVIKIGNVALFGKGSNVDLNPSSVEKIESALNAKLSSPRAKLYNRFSFNGILTQTEDYQKLSKRRNSYFSTKNGKVVSIKHLLVVNTGDVEKIVLRCFDVHIKQFNFAQDAEIGISSGDLYHTFSKSKKLNVYKIRDLRQKCVISRFGNNDVLSELLNRVEPRD